MTNVIKIVIMILPQFHIKNKNESDMKKQAIMIGFNKQQRSF